MDATTIGLLIILASAALAALGSYSIRKLVSLKTLEEYNNVGGNMFQVVGTLYAVLLGLIVVDAMNSMNEIRLGVEQEANSIVNIFILSSGLPSATTTKVRALAHDYVEAVIDEEWRAMEKSSFSRRATKDTIQLWNELISCTPNNDSEQTIRSLALEEMADFGDNRRKRLVASATGVSSILWMVLITGGLFTIFFTYFFGLKSQIGQTMMTSMVAVSVSLNIYLVYLFGYPFSGVYRLEPGGFVAARAVFSVQEKGIDALPNAGELDIQKIKEAGGNLEKLKK